GRRPVTAAGGGGCRGVEAAAGRDRPIQDASAQRRDDGLGGGDRLDGEAAHGTASVPEPEDVARAWPSALGATARIPALRASARRQRALLTYRIASRSASISSGLA